MIPYRKHLIVKGSAIKLALKQLNELAADAILFVVDEHDTLVGSLTDGDVRRGFLRGLGFENLVEEFIQPDPKVVVKGNYDINQIIEFRQKNFRVLPVVDSNRQVINIINFRFLKSYLPVDAVIMAGGKGERLRPLTNSTPKPLLVVGDKPIIEHNINRLISFGIDDFWLSVRYLADQLVNYFGDGSAKNAHIKYIHEDKPLGTVGALGKVQDFRHDYILLMNSDLLTNIDYEDFFLEFVRSEADLSVVTIPYTINIPYAVLETTNGHVVSLKEKPTYTYYSNGGIYLMKKSAVSYIPKDMLYNATDLMEKLIGEGLKVHSYPLRGYWLDIGKPEDFLQAQEDIKHIKF
jgi:dTDP-glucose pyrophosphorylase